jgi:hypothetical protein
LSLLIIVGVVAIALMLAVPRTPSSRSFSRSSTSSSPTGSPLASAG